MARPKRQTVDYFPHFVKGGRTIFILETLTDTDYFEIDFNEVSQELLAADYDITVEELREIVQYCELIGLLQITPENKVFSAAHQRRFSGLINKRERDRERLQTLINKRKQTETEVIAAKTSENEDYRSDNSHSKVKESKGEKSKEEESKEKKSIKYPYQGICDLWNSICVSLPKIAKLTEARKQKIRSRLDEFGCQPEEWLTSAETLFRRVQASDFLTGRKTDWKASFDWVFDNGKNWVKVTEGNYDTKGCGSNRGAQTGVQAQGGQLGVGEFIDGSGRRTYGSGRATIPQDAPPRPSERHQWSAESNTWIIL